MTENEILAFVQKTIPTVCALDVLLLLMRDDQHARAAADLVREMRSSSTAVSAAATALMKAGLIVGDGEYRFAPASPELEQFSKSLVAFYELKPAALVTAIFTAPNPNLRIFADSFKLRD